MFIYMYCCVCLCTYIYAGVHVCLCVYIEECIRVRGYVCVNLCVWLRVAVFRIRLVRSGPVAGDPDPIRIRARCAPDA